MLADAVVKGAAPSRQLKYALRDDFTFVFMEDRASAVAALQEKRIGESMAFADTGGPPEHRTAGPRLRPPCCVLA